MKATATTAKQESLVDAFVHELDAIYYPGYAQELIDSDPHKFDWELKEFQGQFTIN